jgi:hypothetical protein
VPTPIDRKGTRVNTMPQEQEVPPRTPRGVGSWKNKTIIAAVVLVGIFLAGFVPSYLKAKRLEGELLAAREQNALAQLRDLAGLAYLQANQKDYGLAARTTTRLFDGARQMANQTENAGRKQSIEGVLSLRDSITAKLAIADSGVVNDLGALFVKTREATAETSDRPR